MSKLLKNDKFILFVFLLFGGLLSAFLQYDLVWDFMNYHYFNAWAFLNGRVNYDVAVAGLNEFFNPLADIPLYYLIEYLNSYPRVIHFVQGVWFGALLFVFYKIALFYLSTDTLKDKILLVLCLAIALTGQAAFMQIGTSTNEIMIAFLVLLSLYLLLKELFETKSGNRRPFVLSGLILGSAMGLKLTAVIYCLGMGIALLLFYKAVKNPNRNILLFILSGLVGFLLFNGLWMWKMWQNFNNPLFPFANAVFQSPWLSEDNFADSTFVPKSITEFLLWPLILSFSLIRKEGHDMFVSDMRPLIVYFIFIYFGIKYLCNLLRKKHLALEPKYLFLTVFFVLSYVIWAIFFSISRYYVVLEMLSAVYIVKALYYKTPKTLFGEIFYYTFLLLLSFVLLSTPYFSDNWGGRYSWKKLGLDEDAYIAVEPVNIPHDTLFVTYNYPTAGFLAYWGRKVPLRGVNMQQVTYAAVEDGKQFDYFNYHPKWNEKKNSVLKERKGPIFALVSKEYVKKSDINFEKDPLLKHLYCKKLVNNQLPFVYLCVPKGLETVVFEMLARKKDKTSLE